MQLATTLRTYGVFSLIIMAAFFVAYQYIQPPPPKSVIIASGAKDGQYYKFAQNYKQTLLHHGIEAKILETEGSLENIDLLKSKKADIAFIQSGLATEQSVKDIETIYSLYYEPLWVFTSKSELNDKDIQNLSGHRIAAGTKRSGTRAIATTILKHNGLLDNVELIEFSAQDSIKALKDGKVDSIFLVINPESKMIHTLLSNEDFQIITFNRAESYTRQLRYLSKLQIPEGALDLEKNLPSIEVNLISPVALLTTRSDLNGALKTLLAQSAMKIHSQATILSAKGQFPSLNYSDFPIAEEAKRFYSYGPNILQRIFPFWLSDMISRMVVMLIPLIGVMLPLLKIAPPTYRWQTRARIYKWYKNLKKMEAQAGSGNEDIQNALSTLDKIDLEVQKTKVPLSYSDELYNLRLHIQLVRDLLNDQKTK